MELIRNKSGELYIVATPIGNLGDITLRALETLKSVDIIAAEDTRHTIKLLNHYDIKTKMISHHEHNKKESAEGIIKLLSQGISVALVTDAGMPCISDPGYELVKRARQENYNIICLPGASAITAAVALSGLDVGRFRFEGFLPTGNTQRKNLLKKISKDGTAVVIYEAPHRIEKTIQELSEYFDGRKIAIINDISKLHERTGIYEFSNIDEELRTWKLKGEFVLIIEKGSERIDDSWKEMNIKEHIIKVMGIEEISKAEAVKKVATIRNLKKGDVYKESIDI